jgi:HK97 family phage prohead protease
MPLERLCCRLEIKLAGTDPDAKAGTFSGYGSIFNHTDLGGDLVAPGAFKASLKEWKARGKLPKMLLQHGRGFTTEDGIPIGKYTRMEEDDKGLFVEGELFALDTQKGKYVYEGMKAGELDGLSIGYEAVDVTYGKKPEEPYRTLKKIKLYEVSPVTFGMNERALIQSAKSIEDFKTLADAEAFLRDVAGLSQRQAVAFVSRLKSLRPSDSEGQFEAGLVKQIRSLSLT